MAREAKINDLQFCLLDWILVLEEEILRLQIAMHDVAAVHVVNRTQHLPHDNRSLLLCHRPTFDDAVEQFSAGAELHDQVNVLVVLEILVQLDDIPEAWSVPESPENNIFGGVLLIQKDNFQKKSENLPADSCFTKG